MQDSHAKETATPKYIVDPVRNQPQAEDEPNSESQKLPDRQNISITQIQELLNSANIQSPENNA